MRKLIVAVAALMAMLTSSFAFAQSDFPVQTQTYAEEFSDGIHWIVKVHFRGRNVFVDIGSACPISNSEAAGVLGGSPDNWKLLPGTDGTGWKYEGSSPISPVVPFGKMDAPTGSYFAGQTVPPTSVATFWCRG